MFGLNLKAAWRRLVRQKMFSLVNVGGLAVGIAVAVVIFLFAGFELSYDGFHARADGLYRLRLDGDREGARVVGRAKVFGFIGPDLLETAPEVARCARLINLQGIMGNQVMSRGDVSFERPRRQGAKSKSPDKRRSSSISNGHCGASLRRSGD